jgi:hypothetical protein
VFRIATMVAVLALASMSAIDAGAGQLRAAAGKIEITPVRQAYMAGYGSNRRSIGVHDPLWARCLVLQEGSETVALVTCDLIGLTRYNVEKIRALVTKMSPDHVLIGVTHTHSGPDTYGQWGPRLGVSGVDEEWLAGVRKQIAQLVDDTALRLGNARLRLAVAPDMKDCSKNIRVPSILDTDLKVMQVITGGDRTVATLVNYACHPEILDNHQLTSDFPNWLRQTIEAKLGGVAIYTNGAQGGMVTADVKNERSYPKGEAWPEAERIGKALGEAAVNALQGAETVREPRIAFASRKYKVRLTNVNFLALAKAGIFPKDFAPSNMVETEVARFTVGPAEFITMPGEVLPNIGLYLKRHMTGAPRFQLGLTCDALGYILTPQDWGLDLYRYESSVSVSEDMGEKMTENLMALIGRSRRK